MPIVVSPSTIATSTHARTPSARSMSCAADSPRRIASTSETIAKPLERRDAVVPQQLGHRELGMHRERGHRSGRQPLVVDAHLAAPGLDHGQHDARRTVELAELGERPIGHRRDVGTDRAGAPSGDLLQQLLEAAATARQEHARGRDRPQVRAAGPRSRRSTMLATSHSTSSQWPSPWTTRKTGGECSPGRRTASVSMPSAYPRSSGWT